MPEAEAALSDERIDAYLRRLDTQRPAAPDLAALDELHVRHLLSVPFENLSIHLGIPIEIGLEDVYDKIIGAGHGRGGYCYELNSLFAALLRSFGFGVELLSARVASDTGDFGPPFDHLTLAVTVSSGERFLADVGFGESFVHPVPVVADRVHHDRGHRVRLIRGGDGWIYQDDRDADDWTPRYTFAERAHDIDDFAEMNHFQQTSPDSHFTRQAICSRATDRGRITLTDRRLIVRDDGERTEETVDDPTAAVRERFGMALPAPLP